MSEKTIGILGGMGPEATIDLYYRIIKATPACKDQDHIKTIIYSNPKIPDRTKAILSEGRSPLPELLSTASAIKRAGADFIIIPCNTAHYFINALRKKNSLLPSTGRASRRVRRSLGEDGSAISLTRWTKAGGGVWESNPPGTSQPHNGFEDREQHRSLDTSVNIL